LRPPITPSGVFGEVARLDHRESGQKLTAVESDGIGAIVIVMYLPMVGLCNQTRDGALFGPLFGSYCHEISLQSRP
jgi:hypothetical protein